MYLTGVKDVAKEKKNSEQSSWNVYSARSYECYYAFGDVFFYRHTKIVTQVQYMGLFIFKLQIKSS